MTKESSKTPQVQVNSSIDFAVTKEDVLNVLLAEKEDELDAIVSAKRVELDQLQRSMESAEDAIVEQVKSDFKLKKGDALEDEKDLEYALFNHHYNDTGKKATAPKSTAKAEIFNTSRLEGMKNPKMAKNKSRIVEFYPHRFFGGSEKRTVTVYRDMKTSDGLEGTLEGRKYLIISAKAKQMLKELNSVRLEHFKLGAEISKIEFDILILDTDKQTKAAIVKRIVQTSDFKTLLLGE